MPRVMTSDKLDEAFNKRVNRKRSRCGDYIIECKKGHWTAKSPSQPKAEKEARRYFYQQYSSHVHNVLRNERGEHSTGRINTKEK